MKNPALTALVLQLARKYRITPREILEMFQTASDEQTIFDEDPDTGNLTKRERDWSFIAGKDSPRPFIL